ncbi:hypothetical protein [Breznakiella homolactica]|uniref:Lipoprotein n=1 Tax=Breznakiella homolactica TaxID=2798577 RepID=A0A7T8BB02_9SPIR|nr:hypothetical protein [Breznakiella homolactica]QQO10037.1 hypothetical protein JFL75_03735 [Breznakiella homolactica]
MSKKKFLPAGIAAIVLLTSCFSVPKEGAYNNYTYDGVIEKNGLPDYDTIYTVTDDLDQYSEIEPHFALYFSEAELRVGAAVRRLVWEKFSKRLIIWLKEENGVWIVFDSLEYNSTFIKF